LLAGHGSPDFFHHYGVVAGPVWAWVVAGFLRQVGWGEREKMALQGNIIASSSPVLCACRERRRLMVPFKTAPFASFSSLFF